MYQIENARLCVRVRSYGAELISLYDKQTRTEHIWQADPTYWGWYAPVLFPVVGRCTDDTLCIAGKNYSMDKHGFARQSTFELVSQQEDILLFVLRDTEATRTIYPFQFSLFIGYRLRENCLENFYRVENHLTENMYFSIGAHPALAVPFHAGEKYEHYFIDFEKDTKLHRHHINADGFFTGETSLVLDNTNRLLLRENMFADDALIFKNLQSRSVTLGSTLHPKKLRVRFDDFNYLGLWAKVGAPYVCIEPWLGCADTLNVKTNIEGKEAIQTLAPKQNFETQFSLELI